MTAFASISSILVRLTGWLVISTLLSAQMQAEDRGEYEVKAAFLVNFTHFVEWPDPVSVRPFNLCVIGPDPFGAVLEKVVGNRTVNNRPIVIKRFPRPVYETTCEIAFLGDFDRTSLLRLLPALEASHTLTVGDSLEFVERYGTIGFFLENNRVSLALHPERAMKSGLKINSQLMRVARIVSGGRGGGSS